MDAGNLIRITVLLAIAVLVYFVPNWVASSRKHPNANAIFVLNLLLGWTILGWIGALVWAFTSSPQATAPKSESRISVDDTKECPYCAEVIKKAAVVCRFCNRELGASNLPPSPPQAPTNDELMAEFGIRHDGEAYIYQQYRYSKLEDAVAYARAQKA